MNRGPVIEKFSPDTTDEPFGVCFFDALRWVKDGKKITKLEWADSNAFGMMKDGILMIHKQGLVPGGLPGVGFGFSYHAWTISADDMAGTDWVIVE
jgi:hypothetical protein